MNARHCEERSDAAIPRRRLLRCARNDGEDPVAWLDDPVRFFETLLVFTGIAVALLCVGCVIAWAIVHAAP